MSSTFWFDFFKYLLPILAGGLGVLGILNVFKTPHNRLSFWGWLAISLITLSTIAGFFISKKENEDNEADKRLLRQRLDSLTSEMLRVKQPLGDIALTVWTFLPDSNPQVIKYKKYIIDNVKKRKRDAMFANPPLIDRDLEQVAIGIDNEVMEYHIKAKSKFWPGSRFPEIASIASTFSVTFCINSTRLNLDDIRFVMGGHGGDGTLDWCAMGLMSGQSDLFYNVEKDKVGLMTSVNYKKPFVYSNGKITSVRDLLGANVFFVLPASIIDQMDDLLISQGATKRNLEFQREVTRIINGMNISTVLVDLGNGQGFQIGNEFLKKNISKLNAPYFYLTMPKDEAGMYKLTGKE